MMAVAERMSGEPLGTELRPVVEAMAEEEPECCCAAVRTRRSRPRHDTYTATIRTNR